MDKITFIKRASFDYLPGVTWHTILCH